MIRITSSLLEFNLHENYELDLHSGNRNMDIKRKWHFICKDFSCLSAYRIFYENLSNLKTGYQKFIYNLPFMMSTNELKLEYIFIAFHINVNELKLEYLYCISY